MPQALAVMNRKVDTHCQIEAMKKLCRILWLPAGRSSLTSPVSNTKGVIFLRKLSRIGLFRARPRRSYSAINSGGQLDIVAMPKQSCCHHFFQPAAT